MYLNNIKYKLFSILFDKFGLGQKSIKQHTQIGELKQIKYVSIPCNLFHDEIFNSVKRIAFCIELLNTRSLFTTRVILEYFLS